MMDNKDFVEIMTESIETNRYICDSFQDSNAKNLILYKKIITLIVVSFTICIIAICTSFMYSTYKTYDYEGYPETDIVNTNTNTSNSGNINTDDKED
jgi:hypothetical protein